MTEPFVRENADVKEGEKKAFLLAKDIGLLNELKSESMSLEVVFEEAGLEIPKQSWAQSRGKEGRHTEHLGYLLAEMQYLQRTYPNATW
ncbi:MAG: hypothetical protein EOO14_14870 [Chitinophagaceae bacterium]|nr:MAG: hypothetical protein EOO14_14870 [Chitinophagaceae bacterium]